MLGSILGSVASAAVGGLLGNKGSKDANKEAAASAREQMAFQKESAQNSYQWAVADMKKAGLNPMLAYQQGGSSALSGASYRPENTLAGAAASAREVGSKAAEIENLLAQNDAIKSQTQKNISDTKLNEALEKSAHQNANLIASSAKGVQLDNLLKTLDVDWAQSLGVTNSGLKTATDVGSKVPWYTIFERAQGAMKAGVQKGSKAFYHLMRTNK